MKLETGLEPPKTHQPPNPPTAPGAGPQEESLLRDITKPTGTMEKNKKESHLYEKFVKLSTEHHKDHVRYDSVI